MTTEEIEKLLAERLRVTLKPLAYDSDEARATAWNCMRALPWERDEKGLFMRHEVNGALVEDRWDETGLDIQRRVTMPGTMEDIAMDFAIDPKEPA